MRLFFGEILTVLIWLKIKTKYKYVFVKITDNVETGID